MLAPDTLLSTCQDQGRYRVEAYLGGGGFGSAYRVADMTDGQYFVVKTLNLEAEIIAAQPEAAEIFAREAAAAQGIVHRNVVRTFGYVDAQDSGVDVPYLIMEYIAGGDLAGLIAAQNGSYFGQETLVDWMGQLAAGLQAIHRDLLHRDLKPQNVLVDGAALKISDFGMSKYVEDATRTHTFKGGGTWTYMAPETWRGDSATHATDIYSLGIMFYELTTLRLPFIANDLHALRQAHLYGAVPRPRAVRPDLDERLDAMIVRMLAKNPADRYASTSEIARLIARISDPQGSPPLPEGANAVVRLARQKYNVAEAAKARETAAKEEHDEHRLMVNAELRVFADRLDHLVEMVNANLPERPIQVRAGDDYLIDTLNARTYAYFDKTLDLGFFDLP